MGNTDALSRRPLPDKPKLVPQWPETVHVELISTSLTDAAKNKRENEQVQRMATKGWTAWGNTE